MQTWRAMWCDKRCAQVSPSTAFSDSLRQAASMGLLDMTAGGMVIYPSFTAAAPPLDKKEGTPRKSYALTASSQRRSSFGAGGGDETCGRRQAFFEHAGRQMVAQEDGALCLEERANPLSQGGGQLSLVASSITVWHQPALQGARWH